MVTFPDQELINNLNTCTHVVIDCMTYMCAPAYIVVITEWLCFHFVVAVLRSLLS